MNSTLVKYVLCISIESNPCPTALTLSYIPRPYKLFPPILLNPCVSFLFLQKCSQLSFLLHSLCFLFDSADPVVDRGRVQRQFSLILKLYDKKHIYMSCSLAKCTLNQISPSRNHTTHYGNLRWNRYKDSNGRNKKHMRMINDRDQIKSRQDLIRLEKLFSQILKICYYFIVLELYMH